MKSFKTLGFTAGTLLLGSAALLTTGTALAQSFAGFYGQVATGYQWNSVGKTDVNTSTPDTFSPGHSNASTMPLVASVGYNMPIDARFLLGFGGEFSILSASTDTASTVSAGSVGGGYSYRLSSRYGLFIAPAYIIDQERLAYVKLGYTNQRIEGRSHSADGTDGSSIGTDNVGGMLAGVGYRQMIMNRWYGFAEANYLNYGSASLNATSGGISTNARPESSAWNVLVGLGYAY
jgi:hypothetical protein